MALTCRIYFSGVLASLVAGEDLTSTSWGVAGSLCKNQDVKNMHTC